MKCPACNVPLQMTDRSGVEIDYCPQCRGVWLDRGELDKIIERTKTPSRRENGADASYRDRDKGHEKSRRKKRDAGWFGDLFDIGD